MNATTTPLPTIQAGTIPQLFGLPSSLECTPEQEASQFALGAIADSVYDYTVGPPSAKRILSASVQDAYGSLNEFAFVAGPEYAPVRTAPWYPSKKITCLTGAWDQTKREFDQRETKERFLALLSAGFSACAKAIEEAPNAVEADALLRMHRIQMERLPAYAWQSIASQESIASLFGALMAVNARSADNAVDFYDLPPRVRATIEASERMSTFNDRLCLACGAGVFLSVLAMGTLPLPDILWFTIFLPTAAALVVHRVVQKRLRTHTMDLLRDDPDLVEARLQSELNRMQYRLASGTREGG